MKQKAYIWFDDESMKSMQPLIASLITEIWIYDAPQPGETLVLYEGEGKFSNYEVTRRIFGVNKIENMGVWNIYVKPKED